MMYDEKMNEEAGNLCEKASGEYSQINDHG